MGDELDAIFKPFPSLARHYARLKANTYIQDDARQLLIRYYLHAARNNIPTLSQIPRRCPRHIARFFSAIVNEKIPKGKWEIRTRILQKLRAFVSLPENMPDKTPNSLRAQLNAAIRYTPGITPRGRNVQDRIEITDPVDILRHLMEYRQYYPDARFCKQVTSTTKD